MMSFPTVVIIGGGIAGTTCAEYIATLSDGINVVLIAATDVIKTAVTTQKISKLLEYIDVSESKIGAFEDRFPNVSVKIGYVTDIDSNEKFVKTSKGDCIKYDKLCICTGGKPKAIAEGNRYVISIRDTDTVKDMQNKLSKAKKVVVIGNGGIALELVYEICGCEIVWCIKNDYIGNKYMDKGAATFLLPSLHEQNESQLHERKSDQLVFKRKKYETERDHLVTGNGGSNEIGSALGPDWCVHRKLIGSGEENSPRNVQVIYSCETKRIFSKGENVATNDFESSDYNIFVELSNGEIIGSDLVICATGVVPNFELNLISNTEIELSGEGGICVDQNMRTNIENVYAAGDVCEPSWEQAKHWFPMKLWTQGWQMGAFAGKCIVEHYNGSDSPLDFCFELFTHATTFFGYKVCLLGCYNSQKLSDENYDFLVRCAKGEEYIKLVMLDGRVQGAVLIGETDMEETIENLILNQIDVGFLGESLLDPNVDIEDYFD